MARSVSRIKLAGYEISFAERSLPEYSRTFAFTIPKLPEDLRRDMAVGYGICRAIDSIEDSTLERSQQPLYVEAFLALLKNSCKEEKGLVQLLQKVPVTSKGERFLMKNLHSLVKDFLNLPPQIQSEISKCAVTMGHGLIDEKIHEINSIEDQNLYCHFAAGIVGYMITDLFRERGYITKENSLRMMPLAHDFGLALQKVNIIKDINEDYPLKRYFWPSQLLESYDLKYSDLFGKKTEKGKRARGLVEALLADARAYIIRSTQYINSLPSEPPGLKHFCMDNLLFAAATTRVIQKSAEENNFFILPDRGVKITREEVFAIDNNVKNMVNKHANGLELNQFIHYLFSNEAKKV